MEGGAAAGVYNTAAVPRQSDRRLLVNTQAAALRKVAIKPLLFKRDHERNEDFFFFFFLDTAGMTTPLSIYNMRPNPMVHLRISCACPDGGSSRLDQGHR